MNDSFLTYQIIWHTLCLSWFFFFFETRHVSFIQFFFQNHLHSVLEQLKLQEKQKNDQVRNVFSYQAENIWYKEYPTLNIIAGCSL